MRQLGVRTSLWSLNLAAAAGGMLVFAVMRYRASPVSRASWYSIAAGSITAILATFASNGVDGVLRSVSLAGFGLHASAIVAPLIPACVATASGRLLAIATAVATSCCSPCNQTRKSETIEQAISATSTTVLSRH
jgi:hypothetical protein